MSPASPEEVRRKHFTVRMRGFDHDEVHFYLRKLADELEKLQGQVATSTQENQSLRDQLAESRNPMEQATDQAVSVLNQAQQLADSLIDEAMQSARDLLLTARSQQRDIMEQAKDAAKGAVTRATSIAERASSEDPTVRDVEYIRMFTKVAQVQFQAVLDALNEHVNSLGESPEITRNLRFDPRAGDTVASETSLAPPEDIRIEPRAAAT
jgi:DivIVA domain-containing protein